MKILLIIISIICCNEFCFAQDYPANDTLVNKYLIELQQKGVDTICTYQAYFPGSFRMFKPGLDTTCIHSNRANVYFLWKLKGVTFITFMNSCCYYNIVSINGDKLWHFYIANKTKISTEKIKEFEMIGIDNGKKEIVLSIVDHSPRQDITLIIGKKRIEQHFDGYAFEKVDSENNPNINYLYNLNAKSTKFKAILEDMIKEVSDKGLLKKITQ